MAFEQLVAEAAIKKEKESKKKTKEKSNRGDRSSVFSDKAAATAADAPNVSKPGAP